MLHSTYDSLPGIAADDCSVQWCEQGNCEVYGGAAPTAGQQCLEQTCCTVPMTICRALQLTSGLCSGVREAAMDCIQELHQQLGGSVLDRLEALSVKPAQLKELQTRLGQLAASSEAIQAFPLFHAVTAEGSRRQAGSITSRSESSNQVRQCTNHML